MNNVYSCTDLINEAASGRVGPFYHYPEGGKVLEVTGAKSIFVLEARRGAERYFKVSTEAAAVVINHTHPAEASLA